jgi:hypothetical protein
LDDRQREGKRLLPRAACGRNRRLENVCFPSDSRASSPSENHRLLQIALNHTEIWSIWWNTFSEYIRSIARGILKKSVSPHNTTRDWRISPRPSGVQLLTGSLPAFSEIKCLSLRFCWGTAEKTIWGFRHRNLKVLRKQCESISKSTGRPPVETILRMALANFVNGNGGRAKPWTWFDHKSRWNWTMKLNVLACIR